MSTLYSVFVVNNAPGCNNTEIEQQLPVTGCTTFIIRLSQNSNALGPFDVFYGLSGTPLSAATTLITGQTRTQMFNGVLLTLECATPTPTPTPTVTPPPSTPTQTPTNTQTPSVTPDVTPTPSHTPTYTPSETPTQTPSGTPANTPTPTSTPSIFEIYIITQDGQELLNQDGSQWIAQQEVTAFIVTTGDTTSIAACSNSSYTLTLYSSSQTWENVNSLFTNSTLTTPVNGGDNWYSDGIYALQINSSGIVTAIDNCPV